MTVGVTNDVYDKSLQWQELDSKYTHTLFCNPAKKTLSFNIYTLKDIQFLFKRTTCMFQRYGII